MTTRQSLWQTAKRRKRLEQGYIDILQRHQLAYGETDPANYRRLINAFAARFADAKASLATAHRMTVAEFSDLLLTAAIEIREGPQE